MSLKESTGLMSNLLEDTLILPHSVLLVRLTRGCLLPKKHLLGFKLNFVEGKVGERREPPGRCCLPSVVVADL